jgi:hypothetical protein
MHADQDRIATARSRRHRVDQVLATEPFAIEDAVFNKQVLSKPPSRLRTTPFPYVTSGRGTV